MTVDWEKKILFAIGNGAHILDQILANESPAVTEAQVFCTETIFLKNVCCCFKVLTLFTHLDEGFCQLLLIFAHSLDPDQARPNIVPILNPNRLIH